MTKRKTLYLLLILIILIIGSVFIFTKNKKVEKIKTANTFESRLEAEKILNGMSLDQKLGQIIITGLQTNIADETTQNLIVKYHIGGFNFLEKNIINPEQTQKLTSEIQNLAAKNGYLPIFLAVDQEGGPISRVKFLKELTPQSQIRNETEAFKVAKRRAHELKELGFNVIFSPILDYPVTENSYLYSRAFHDSSENIQKLGSAMISGYKSENILAVAKHFPSYGSANLDPHKILFLLSKNDLETSLEIFAETIKKSRPEAIMTAHVFTEQYNNEPATTNPEMIDKILKNKIGFQGLVITDDLEMISASQNKTLNETAIKAILAGNDILIITKNPEKIPEVIKSIKNSVQTNKISEYKINQTVLKIINVKLKLSH